MIEEHPAFGYRTVAHLLDFNKNTVQRIFQLNGMAGEETADRLQASRAGHALGGSRSERTLVNRSVPGLGWPGWMDRAWRW